MDTLSSQWIKIEKEISLYNMDLRGQNNMKSLWHCQLYSKDLENSKKRSREI